MQHDWLNGVVIPDVKHSGKRNRLTIHRMTVTGPYNARSSQSIKIAIDLSIDKSLKIGNLIWLTDIDRIDQSVEIDDTLLSFIDLYRFYRFHRFYLKIHLFFCSVSSKNENWFHANSEFVDNGIAIESRRIRQFIITLLKKKFKKILYFL